MKMRGPFFPPVCRLQGEQLQLVVMIFPTRVDVMLLTVLLAAAFADNALAIDCLFNNGSGTSACSTLQPDLLVQQCKQVTT